MRIEDIKTIKEFVESPIFFVWRMTHEDKEIHHCYGCDLIKEELNDRIEKDAVDQCAYSTFEDFISDIREMCDYCWCPKYGGKTWWIAEGHKEEYKECTKDLEAES
jgi:hypothetical protein